MEYWGVVSVDLDQFSVKSGDAVMVAKDTNGDEGVRIELGEDMGGSGGWWKGSPINGSSSSRIDMVMVGKVEVPVAGAVGLEDR